MKNLILLILMVTFLPSLQFPQGVSGELGEDWRTKAELTDFRETPSYDETVSYGRRLAAASELIEIRMIGRSSEGRDIPLLIAAKKGNFDPRSAKVNKKAVILVQAAIHAGESDGKDAGLALLRDIAVTGALRDLLDQYS